MHSKRLSVIIGVAIIAVDIFLFIIYFQKQGKYTFDFVKSLYKYIMQ